MYWTKSNIFEFYCQYVEIIKRIYATSNIDTFRQPYIWSCPDLVWGDKHDVTSMYRLQVLQNKAVKIILDRPLYSSVTHAFATLKCVPLEKRRFQTRCIYVYKCLNGLVEHDMNFIRKNEGHDYYTRTNYKLNFRLPSFKRIGSSSVLHFMPSRILTPLARQL